jgi:hypothetical protein
VASLDNVSHVDEVFSDRTPRDEASLVRVNQGDEVLEAKSETFGVDLEAAVMKGDGAKVPGLVSTILLRQKDDVRLVDRPEVRG